MFKYEDGSAVQIGDSILFNNGKAAGVVDLVVNTPEEVKDFKVAEIGVMVNAADAGLVYLTKPCLEVAPITLVTRAKRKPLFQLED